jgi:hypothetical protein
MRFLYILLVLGVLFSCEPKNVEVTQENIEAILKEDFTFKIASCGCFGYSNRIMRIDLKKQIIDYKLFSGNDSLFSFRFNTSRLAS